jgi:type IV pilus assembly protein PilM
LQIAAWSDHHVSAEFWFSLKTGALENQFGSFPVSSDSRRWLVAAVLNWRMYHLEPSEQQEAARRSLSGCLEWKLMKRRLIIDVGPSAVRLLEVAVGDGVLRLLDAAVVGYPSPLRAGQRAVAVAAALREVRKDRRFVEREAVLCLSADLVWVRAVSLPPVDPEAERLRQIIDYEAKQEIPFPLERVCWDHQLVVRGDEDLEVVFAVAKQEIVAELMEALRMVGLRVSRIECAPTALYNLARANGFGTQRCEMLIEFGSRTTIVLILLGNRFFLRSIAMGGESLTQALAREFGISRDEAELLKRRHAFVALGDGYEEPESEVAAMTARVTRRVMTKLVGELKRTIGSWRGSADGAVAPEVVHFTGGGSVIPFLPEYLSQRMGVPILPLNPLAPMELSPQSMTETLQNWAHCFGKASGAALREAAECPVEVDLLPAEFKKDRRARLVLPYVGAAAALWLSLLTAGLLLASSEAEVAATRMATAQATAGSLTEAVSSVEASARRLAALECQRERLARLRHHREAANLWWQAVDQARPSAVRLTRIEPLSESAELVRTSIFLHTAQASTATRITGLRLEGVASAEPGAPIFEAGQLAYLRSLAAAKPDEGGDDGVALPAGVADEANVATADVSRVINGFLAGLQSQSAFAADLSQCTSFATTGEQAGRFVIEVGLVEPVTEWGLE